LTNVCILPDTIAWAPMVEAARSVPRDRRRLAVISGYGRDPYTPRGQRTRHLVEALQRDWDTALIAFENLRWAATSDGSKARLAPLRRLAAKGLGTVLLDRWEPWSARHLGRWHPDCDGAVLIAAPWSPAVYAGRRLVAAGIPYVLDVGDPWVLTYKGDHPLDVPIGRATRGERFLWEHAAGATLTTESQRAPLQEMFPDLPMLIRPNGYNVVEMPPVPRERADRRRLRIGHLGILTRHRVDPVPMLLELARSGNWDQIELIQYGEDFGAGLERLRDAGIRVEHNDSRPWAEVAPRLPELDLMLAVAWPMPMLLPSKAIEYSAVPLPRLAWTNPDADDALRLFAAEHEGWLAISPGEADIPARVLAHVERDWSAVQLAPLPEDAWPEVARTVAGFVDERLSRR
jgi:hypothetical protein